MEIRRGNDPETGNLVLALINCIGDEVSMLATEYNAPEIEFFKRCIQIIVTGKTADQAAAEAAYKGNSEANAAANASKFRAKSNQLLSGLVKGISKRDSEILLDRFVSDGWLIDVKGKFSFSTRSLLELKGYLREEFGEEIIPDCALCKELVTVKRQACRHCPVKLHHYCLERLGAGTVKCPGCKKSWESAVLIAQQEE